MSDRGAPGRKRPKRGSVDGKPLLLKLPADLRAAAVAAAEREGVTTAEWIREAIRLRLAKKAKP